MPGGRIDVYNAISGQLVGYGSNYGSTQLSNVISIGAPSTDDIQFSFLKDAEYTGPHSPANASNYDPAGDVKISTTGTSVAVLSYQCNINELDAYGNEVTWWGSGWINGTVPNPIDISNKCLRGNGNPTNWTTGHSYTIQIAIDDDPCGTGTYEQLFQTFYICPSGDGCELTDVSTPVSLSPNPANASFRLNNVLFTPGAEYHLTLTDLSGRIVKEYSNVSQQAQTYDISDISTGLYVASLWNGTEKVFTDKLSIAK